MKSVYVLGPELSALRFVNLIGGSIGPLPGGPFWRLSLSLVELGLLERSEEGFLITKLGSDVIEQSEQHPLGARAFVRLGTLTTSAELEIGRRWKPAPASEDARQTRWNAATGRGDPGTPAEDPRGFPRSHPA